MDMTLVVHITAGTLGLLSGYTALYAAKGANVHRKAGLLFVAAMLVMCAAGVVVAAGRDVATAINLPAGFLTAYLVVTALLTVRPRSAASQYIDVASMLVALAVGASSLFFAYQAVQNGGTRNGVPAFPFFLFGTVAMIAAIGDIRMLRTGVPRGAARIARHLWRMTFALWIAALSFFLGQAQVIPEPIRKPPLLALPVVAVFVTMLYWLWRVRVRRSLRGMVRITPEVVPNA
jgi:hypothetical protein